VIERDQLATYVHELLACATFEDYAPNGLQIEGRHAIRRIATAVTASKEAISEAIAFQADALLVHHGYFWRGEATVITGMKRERIGKLMAQDMSLFAYHLPLDCHLALGNNACLGRLLSIETIQTHSVNKTANLLWSGSFAKPIAANAFAREIETKLGRKPLLVSGSVKPIERIAWCSGGAQDFIEEASHLGVDAYLSGEISERTYYQAQELQLHYFAAGHHATERFGIQALGHHLADQFALDHLFIDSANPV
jgi:dinuclear metal center YbgI/SA1388 family protein